MNVDTIMNLQYRKILTVKEDLWQDLREDWDSEGDIQIPLTAAMSLFIIDLDSLSYPEIGEEERAFLGQMIRILEEHPDEDVMVSLTDVQRQDMTEIAGKFRLDDEWHKYIVLRFANLANYLKPVMFIGKGMLEEIL